MQGMDDAHIETESTLALFRLRQRLRERHGELAPYVLHYEHVRPSLTVLRDACAVLDKNDVCDALDKGAYGREAIRTLIDLSRALELDKGTRTGADLDARSEDRW
jgi:hypothetical protein